MTIYRLNLNNDISAIHIGFDIDIKKGDKLPQYKNFEYIPPKEYVTNKGSKMLQILKFKNVTPERKKIISKILEAIEEFNENWTISGILEMFNEYFSKNDEDCLVSNLVGDIGEIVFILKLQELNIDYRKYYQMDEHSLYDFTFNKIYVDVKTTSEGKKIINMSKRQIENCQRLWLFVCEINKIQGKLNVVNLLNMIKNKNRLIFEKLKYWQYKLDSNKRDVILSWTVDLEKVKCYLIDSEVLPKIEIKKEGGLVDISLKLSTTNCKKQPVEAIKKVV